MAPFPGGVVPVDIVRAHGVQDKKTPVDPSLAFFRFLVEIGYVIVLPSPFCRNAGRTNGCHGGQFPVAFVTLHAAPGCRCLQRRRRR